MTPLAGTIYVDANGNVTGRLTEAATPPNPNPNPPNPPNPNPPAPPATGSKLDRTKQNVHQLLSEGGRGRVLAWHYFNVGNGYLYKSPLQDWLAQVLPQFGTDYAHWTDPTSYAGADWYGLNNDELTRILAMQRTVNQA